MNRKINRQVELLRANCAAMLGKWTTVSGELRTISSRVTCYCCVCLKALGRRAWKRDHGELVKPTGKSRLQWLEFGVGKRSRHTVPIRQSNKSSVF